MQVVDSIIDLEAVLHPLDRHTAARYAVGNTAHALAAGGAVSEVAHRILVSQHHVVDLAVAEHVGHRVPHAVLVGLPIVDDDLVRAQDQLLVDLVVAKVSNVNALFDLRAVDDWLGRGRRGHKDVAAFDRGEAVARRLHVHVQLLDRCDLADHIDLFRMFLIQSDLGKRDRKPLSIIIVESAAALKTRTLSQASSVMIPSSTVCTTVSISRRMDSLLWLRWLISRVSAIRSFTYFAVT